MINTALWQHPFIIYGFYGLFVLAIGSLLNVIIYRLPLMLEAEWEKQCQRLFQQPTTHPLKTISLWFPRSFCPSCKHTIHAGFNIPILSYCLLRGRCHYCQHPISCRYPLVELICLLLSFFAAWHFGINVSLLFILPFIWILLCLFFIDLEHQLLPDELTLTLLWLGLIANTESLFTTPTHAILSAVGAYMTLWCIIKGYAALTGKIGMGHGDFKLFAAFGAWFGWAQLPLILFVSSITGIVIGVTYLKITKKPKDTPLPFGPFLCLAGLLSLFYGQSIIQWYWDF